MGTSQKTLDQVKSILDKLDRRIDAVRQRRLHPADAVPAPSPAPGAAPLPARPIPAVESSHPAATFGASHMSNGAATQPSSSPYGRARPMRSND